METNNQRSRITKPDFNGEYCGFRWRRTTMPYPPKARRQAASCAPPLPPCQALHPMKSRHTKLDTSLPIEGPHAIPPPHYVSGSIRFRIRREHEIYDLARRRTAPNPHLIIERSHYLRICDSPIRILSGVESSAAAYALSAEILD
jgi:hypothetical protein